MRDANHSLFMEHWRQFRILSWRNVFGRNHCNHSLGEPMLCSCSHVRLFRPATFSLPAKALVLLAVHLRLHLSHASATAIPCGDCLLRGSEAS